MVKISFDAGHGLYTAGKRCAKSLDPKETREWVLNNRVLVNVLEQLKDYEDVETLRVDDPTGKQDISLYERSSTINNWHSQMHISIHHNAAGKVGNHSGIVVFRHPLSSDATKNIQEALYNKLIEHTGLKGNRANPMAEKNLHMVRVPKMPSPLLELGFMDSRIDVPIILMEEHADECADAIVEFLREYFNLKKKIVAVPPKKDYVLPEGKFFRVIVGSFQSRNNAEAMQKELAEDGFDSFLAIYEK